MMISRAKCQVSARFLLAMPTQRPFSRPVSRAPPLLCIRPVPPISALSSQLNISLSASDAQSLCFPSFIQRPCDKTTQSDFLTLLLKHQQQLQHHSRHHTTIPGNDCHGPDYPSREFLVSNCDGQKRIPRPFQGRRICQVHSFLTVVLECGSKVCNFLSASPLFSRPLQDSVRGCPFRRIP
jgi:hypothetical protein